MLGTASTQQRGPGCDVGYTRLPSQLSPAPSLRARLTLRCFSDSQDEESLKRTDLLNGMNGWNGSLQEYGKFRKELQPAKTNDLNMDNASDLELETLLESLEKDMIWENKKNIIIVI